MNIVNSRIIPRGLFVKVNSQMGTYSDSDDNKAL